MLCWTRSDYLGTANWSISLLLKSLWIRQVAGLMPSSVQAASISSVVKPEMTHAKKIWADIRIGHFRFDNSPNMKRSFAVKEFCLFEFSILGIIYGLICQAAGTLAQGKNLWKRCINHATLRWSLARICFQAEEYWRSRAARDVAEAWSWAGLSLTTSKALRPCLVHARKILAGILTAN